MADLLLLSTFSACITVIILLFLLFVPIMRYRFYRRGVPRGTLGLPIIGETLRLISAYRSDNPEPFVDERRRKYGKVFTTHLFGEPTVFSADAEVNRYVLQNEGKIFEGSYPSSISNLLGKHSLVLMKGSLHKRMHSLTMSFANSAIIRDHLLSHIDRLLRRNLSSWPHRVLLMEEAKKITFEISMKQLMSLEQCEWTESLRREYVQVIEGFFTVPFFSFTYRRAIKARGKVVHELNKVVADRRKESEGGIKKDDMLEAMLSSEEKLSDEQIVDFLVALLVAGYETTSTIMTLAVKFLTDAPMALAVLREEHDELRRRRKVEQQQKEDDDCAGSDDEAPLRWSDYKSMEFTQCVINETLRMANIIGGIFRRATADVNVKGYLIPKGWKVFASFRAVHLDEDSFDDARLFNPWRWQQKQSSGGGTTKVNNAVFMPFGGGPRICPGYELARVVLSAFLHHIVTQFTWEAAEEDELVHFPTTRTKKRYPILLKRRRLTAASES